MKLKIQSLETKMINWTMLLTKENKVLENKLNTGNPSSMRLKDNMLTFKVN